MKSLLVLSVGFAIVLAASGCNLSTDNQGGPRSPLIGKDLTVTEVFNISPDKYYSFSWVELFNPTTRDIKWFDETRPASGYAVGAGGTILHTLDDGNPWNDSLGDARYNTIYSINFPNRDTGFAVGQGGVILKINKTGVQTLRSGTTNTLRGVFAAGPDLRNRTAFAVGDRGTILRTTNQGNTWTRYNPSDPVLQQQLATRNLRGIGYTALTAIYAVGDSGTIMKSTNSGTDWTMKNIPEPFRGTTFNAVFFVGADTGWMMGENGKILRSENGGSLWSPETTNVTATLRGGYFATVSNTYFQPDLGWIVGDGGLIMKTTDFGVHWNRQTSGTSANLNGVTFVDSLRGWAYGDGGIILTTTNGGTTWKSQQSTTTQNIYSMQFLDLAEIVQNYYELRMLGERRYVFFDITTGAFNFDFIVRKDTGIISFIPGGYFIPPPQFPGPAQFFPDNVVINPGQFFVLNSDSLKFKDHIKYGPGDYKSSSFGLVIDTVGFSRTRLPRIFKWNLLSRSEIRLVRVFIRRDILGRQQGDPVVRDIDVVRLGGYTPADPLDYPQNKPQGRIPEWYSMARFNDLLFVDPSTENSATSFYMTQDPIPGYYSLLSSTSGK